MSEVRTQPKYPVYVISKGRWELRPTEKALTKRNIPHFVVIEPQEYDQYASVMPESKLLVLPFSNLGQGSIPARNWCWEHSISQGHEKHWILDDNIRTFYRLHKNMKWTTTNGITFALCEEHTDRFRNVALSGMQYEGLTPRGKKHKPFRLNTRIYSCILIRNDIPYRWRGKYNEDTDLSLRALKDGWCTILYIAYLCEKRTSMTMKGGNTDELYERNEKFDGRLEMAKSLQAQHPDVTRVVYKWKRWQHSVDYTPFAKNKLRYKEGFVPPTEPDEHGMNLRYIGKK